MAGQLNRAEPETEAVKAFGFFPWQWVNSPFISDFLSIKSLADMGFPLVQEHTYRTASYPEIKQHLEHYATVKKPQFLMDGIVIKVDNIALRKKLGRAGNTPVWAMAWKFPPATATSEVQTIEFTIGRTGHITPVVHIKPVMVKNRTLSTISLGSIQNLNRKNLAVRDQISITLKGSASPVFAKVLFRPENRIKPELLDTNLYTPFTCLTMSPDCEEQFIARLEWLVGKQGLQLSGISKPRIQQLVSSGKVKTLVDILKLDQQTLHLSGMGMEESQQYLTSIQRAKTIDQQIIALSIPTIGKNRATKLARCIKDLPLFYEQISNIIRHCLGIREKEVLRIVRYLDLPEVKSVIDFLTK